MRLKLKAAATPMQSQQHFTGVCGDPRQVQTMVRPWEGSGQRPALQEGWKRVPEMLSLKEAEEEQKEAEMRRRNVLWFRCSSEPQPRGSRCS